MRIGLISPPWLAVPPVNYGGIESMVDTLAVALLEAGHEVLLAAPSDSTCEVGVLPGFAPAQLTALGETVAELSHVVRAYSALDAVDVIHDHTVVGAFYGAHSTRVPIVSTVHGPFTSQMLDIFRAMPSNVSLVAISRHQSSTATGVSISRVIHHGMDPSRVPFGAGDGGYACFLGRMHPHKGVAQAIRISRSAGIPLRIAARCLEPIEREYFESVVKPLLGPDTEYLGELNAVEKYELLGGAVALINPIQWDEPFGLVMIEALATGTPVVAWRRASAPEIVEHGVTGFLGDDEESLALALTEAPILDRSDCRSAVESQFSSERMALEHINLYQSLQPLPLARPRVPRLDDELPTGMPYR